MTKHRRLRRTPAIAAVLVAAVGLAACGSSGHGAGAPGSSAGKPSAGKPSTASASGSPSASASAGPGLTVPATVVRDRTGEVLAFVTVTIKGHKTAFIVDSGASTTVLDLTAAKRAGLTLRRSTATTRTVGCTMTPYLAKIDDWSLGGKSLPAAQVLAQDEGFKGAKVGGLPIGGLLGADFQFGTKTVRIDYATRKVTFGAPVAAGGKSVPIKVLRKGANVAVSTKLTVASTRVVLQIDTGAGHTIVTSAAAARLKLPRTGKAASVNAAGCPAKVQPVKLSDAKLGAVPLPDATVNSTAKGGIVPGSVGLLGSDILSTFKVITIDYAGRKLVLGA